MDWTSYMTITTRDSTSMFIPPNAESQLEPKLPLKNPLLQPSGAIPRLKVRVVQDHFDQRCKFLNKKDQDL